MHLESATKDVPIETSAVGYPNATFVMANQVAWGDPTEFDRHIEWARDFLRNVQPNPRGNGYINFQTEDEGEDRTRQVYPAEIYERLVEVRNRYDLANMLRFNRNIRPT